MTAVTRLLISLALTIAWSSGAMAQAGLKVMTFNVWGAGSNAGKDIEETVRVIRAANPDIIGLQEVRPESSNCESDHCPPDAESLAPQLASALGYEFLEQLEDNEVLWANAILSRFPIVSATPGGLGARIAVGACEVLLFNIHTTDYPYGPYQLLSIPYGEAAFVDTAEQAIAAAWKARKRAYDMLKKDLHAAPTADLVFITGDFNEPSHRDWTASTVAEGIHPVEVAWPFTRAVEGLGFIDVYRSKHPDPLARPGFTWTPNMGDDTVHDHRDRIDYIFARGEGLRVESARVVGETGPWSDITIDPFPSDHRAVVAEINSPCF